MKKSELVRKCPMAGIKYVHVFIGATRTKIAFYQDVDSEKEWFIVIRRIRL